MSGIQFQGENNLIIERYHNKKSSDLWLQTQTLDKVVTGVLFSYTLCTPLQWWFLSLGFFRFPGWWTLPTLAADTGPEAFVRQRVDTHSWLQVFPGHSRQLALVSCTLTHLSWGDFSAQAQWKPLLIHTDTLLTKREFIKHCKWHNLLFIIRTVNTCQEPSHSLFLIQFLSVLAGQGCISEDILEINHKKLHSNEAKHCKYELI